LYKGETKMIIKLIQPPSHYWLLIGDQLNDPDTWTRFIPCHTSDSDRYLFDSTVRSSGAMATKLKAQKDLMRRGRSVFEYDWQSDETDILAHAMQVADQLGLELIIMDAADGLAVAREVA